MEQKRMKLATPLRSLENFYSCDDPQYFWAKVVGDVVIQLSLPHTCRESLASVARSFINKGGKIIPNAPRTVESIFLNRTRIVMVIDNTMGAKWMEGGLHILNLVEAHYGWPLTKMNFIKKVTRPNIGQKYEIALFDGSRKWLRSTHMISFFTLLIRLGRNKHIREVKTFEEMKKRLAKYKQNMHGDTFWAAQAIEKADVIMGDYTKLFRGFNRKSLYETTKFKDTIDRSGFNEGISKLCREKSFDKKLLNRLQNICKEHKARAASA